MNLAQKIVAKRPTRCQECGDEGRVFAHHEDCGRPLDVMWLCPACHRTRHSLCHHGRAEIVCVSLSVDTARVIQRVAIRLGHSKSALVRVITDAWAKGQKRES